MQSSVASPFAVAHATHPDWRVALDLASAQFGTHAPAAGALGLVYFSDRYAAHAEALFAALAKRYPGVAWAGCVGAGVAAGAVEYFDEPALVLMACALAPQQFEVFSGVKPLSRIAPFTALVHADPGTPEMAELIGEMSRRTESGYLFGGLAWSRGTALTVADGIWRGGLSGVAFSADVGLVSRVTQGCQPVGTTRTITRAELNVITELDGQPALPLLLADLGLAGLDDHRKAMPRLRATLAGVVDASDSALARGGQFGPDVRVRHLIGIDPARHAIALADRVEAGQRLTFCGRDVQAARRDLVRICAEIRDEVDTAPMRGAVYVSCAGRGGPHFGGPNAELEIVRHALGEVPLVGFFAAGEIARHHLYGYTGVLTVFRGAAP